MTQEPTKNPRTEVPARAQELKHAFLDILDNEDELNAIRELYQTLLKNKEDEIKTIKEHHKNELEELCSSFNDSISECHLANDAIQEDLDITEGELSIVQKSEKEWIGRTLKLKFILDNIKRVEALPKDYAEVFDPMVEQIDIPEGSIAIRSEFVVTEETDNIDWTTNEYDSQESDNERYDWFQFFNDERRRVMLRQSGDPTHQPTTHELMGISLFGNHRSNEDILNDPDFDLWWRGQPEVLVSLPPAPDMMANISAFNNRWAVCRYGHPRAVLELRAKTIQRAWRSCRQSSLAT